MEYGGRGGDVLRIVVGVENSTSSSGRHFHTSMTPAVVLPADTFAVVLMAGGMGHPDELLSEVRLAPCPMGQVVHRGWVGRPRHSVQADPRRHRAKSKPKSTPATCHCSRVGSPGQTRPRVGALGETQERVDRRRTALRCRRIGCRRLVRILPGKHPSPSRSIQPTCKRTEAKPKRSAHC